MPFTFTNLRHLRNFIPVNCLVMTLLLTQFWALAANSQTYVRLSSRIDNALAVNVERSPAPVLSPIQLGAWSADWVQEGSGNSVRIKNRWRKDYLAVVQGRIVLRPKTDPATVWSRTDTGGFAVLRNNQSGLALANVSGTLGLASGSGNSDSRAQWLVQERLFRWPGGAKIAGGKAVQFAPTIIDRSTTLDGKQTAQVHMVLTPFLARQKTGGTYLYISLEGSEIHASKGGDLWKDTYLQRGYFLESAKSRITVQGQGIQLLASGDVVENDSGSVTSSLSDTRSANLEAGLDSLKLGFSNSTTEGWSFSRNLSGYKVRSGDSGTVQGGGGYTEAKYAMSGVKKDGSGGLMDYSKWQDIVDVPQDGAGKFWRGFSGVFSGDAWQSYHMHGVPDRAKSGMPVVSQASFYAGPNNRGMVKATATFDMTFRNVYSSGETKLDSTYGSTYIKWSVSIPVEIDLSMATYN